MLNSVIEEAAAANSATFVGTFASGIGHDACKLPRGRVGQRDRAELDRVPVAPECGRRAEHGEPGRDRPGIGASGFSGNLPAIRFRRDGSRRDYSRRHLTPNLGVHDMAIDLGTANTLVYVGGRGIVVSEPSVVASDVETGAVHAVGADAERMIGRTPATIAATRPLRHGVIADFEVTEEMLRYFIRKVIDRRLAHPRLIVCAPSGVTEVEKRAVEEASLAAGARRVHLIEEPIAAAIGAGLAIDEPVGRMVVNVGGGTSEMAVISLGGIVLFRSVRVGGYDMDEAITQHLRVAHHLAIGSRTAEAIKITIGSAMPLQPEETMQVKGRHLLTGLPTSLELSSAEVRAAIMSPLREILQAIRDTLEETPPELSGDIAREGILLAGGGTLVRAFPELVAEETGMPVARADSPLTCVAVGSGQALAHLDKLRASGAQRRFTAAPDWRTA
jgi:rod shape-determining protein MreB